MTYHFPKKILGSRISLTYRRLMKSYDELRKNLTKISRSFEDRAPVLPRRPTTSCYNKVYHGRISCQYNGAKLLTIQSVKPGRHLVSIHQVAPPKWGSTHQISAYYSIYRPRKDERLSWPSWSTYIGRFIHVSSHPSAAGQAQDRKVRRGITDVLPLCYATNLSNTSF